MPQLLGIGIKNYRALKSIKIGQLKYQKNPTPLPSLSCFIGKNGSGKSTLLDALGFLADSLRFGVEVACDAEHRGGFEALRTQGSNSPIEFQLYYKVRPEDRPVRYQLHVDLVDGVPAVVRERLEQARPGVTHGKLSPFLDIKNGRGYVLAGEALYSDKDRNRENVRLADPRQLGITTLGNLREHPRIVSLREYIEGWYLSYFIPNAARKLPPAGAQRYLDREGTNVGNVLQYFQRQYPGQFDQILGMIARSIPGINRVEAERSVDGRLLIKFDENGYLEPFFQRSMSDGTLKMLAYAILLADPEPRPFLGIEEPENGLYHQLLGVLARELRKKSEESSESFQILVTTHSPYFVDELLPEQVWIMGKDSSGHVKVNKTSEHPAITEMVEEGVPLGALWYSNHFEGSGQ